MISNEVREHIKIGEALRLKAYKCPAGILSIGYGHTSDKKFVVKPDSIITKEFAEELLDHDIAEAEEQLQKEVNVKSLNLNQYSALVSIVYNCGSLKVRFKRHWIKSNLIKRIDKKEFEDAGEIIKSFKIMANGKKLQGLVNRRAKESKIFLTPTEEVIDPAEIKSMGLEFLPLPDRRLFI